MLNPRTYFSLIVAVIFATASLSGQTKKNKTHRGESLPIGGPQWVIQSLSKAGVFKVPEISFSGEYDEYKEFENIKGLFFKGLDYHGKETKVFCWYGVPELLIKGHKAPAVVLVHGGGGTVFPQWIKKWTDHGYIAISVALEGQIPGPKSETSPLEVGHPNHEFSGPFRKGFFLDVMDEELENQWFYHAVADVILANSLLRSFPEVDTTKIGITGISWGGILTNVISGIDNRFAFAIPVYGCGYLHEAPTYIEQLKAHTPESKQFYLENWEPSLYVPLQKQPTLFVNGTNDGHFSMNSFTKTYEASGAEKYLHIEHEMKHGHSPGWNPEEIYRFADYIVHKGDKPIVFNTSEKAEIFAFEGDVNGAVAYYTNDTADWSGKACKWIKIEAKISNKKIHVDLPGDALYYFVNGTTTDNMMYSSPMKKVGINNSK